MTSYFKKNPAINTWGVVIGFATLALIIMMPDIAAATGASTGFTRDDNNISRTLCNIIILLQGNISRGIAAGGVIFLGFSLFLGKIAWGTALALGLGLGAIFGAQQIVNLASTSGGSDGLNCVRSDTNL